MEMSFNTEAFNMEEFNQAKSLLKTRFPMMVEGYLEDAEMYLTNIEKGIAENDLMLISQNAHPLKSSSASLGVMGVSEIAKVMEMRAKDGAPLDQITPLLDPLKQAIAFGSLKMKAEMG